MSDLIILSRHRRRIFDSIPRLTVDERMVYINLDEVTRKYLRNKKSHRKVGYLLHKAYFQAKGRFFDLSTAHKRDINSAGKRLNLGSSYSFEPSEYSTTLQNEDKQHILQAHGWHAYKPSFAIELMGVARLLVARRYETERILFSLLDHCWAKRVSIPSYATLTKIVTESMREYESSVLDKWHQHSTSSVRTLLLNQVHSNKTTFSLSDLKTIDQDDSLQAMSRNANILSYCRDMFFAAESSLTSVDLMPEGIRHFSDQISKNDIAQLRRQKNEANLSLNLACFIQDQFYQRQDATFIAFKKVIRSAVNMAKKQDQAVKAQREEEHLETNRQVVDTAKQSRAVIREIYTISKDGKKPLSQRNEQVIHLIEAFFGEGDEDDISRVFDTFENDLINLQKRKGYYHYLFDQHTSLIRKLSPALRALTFDSESSNPDLIEAIEYFRSKDSEFNEKAPTEFLNESEKELVMEESNLPAISRWKILLFCAVIIGIRDKKLILKYSYKYREDQSYLIPLQEWLADRDTLIRRANLESFVDGPQVLEKIGRHLNQQYYRVNDMIDRNEIEGFQKRPSGWMLKKLDADYDNSKFIPSLLSNHKAVTLYELLAEIDKYAEFSKVLQTDKSGKELSSIKLKQVYATIMSLGTNLGHHNMARAARNISEKQLRDTEKQWLSPSSLSKANEAMVSFIQSLSLPKVFHNNEGELHTSSDGKKITVAVNSLLANFSYKYYGKEQGITANSYTDEFQAFFNINVHTSSDREAASMLDGMVESTRALYPEGEMIHWHSTDQHGFTEAVFAGMHFINVSFAPRFAKIHKQALCTYDDKTKQAMKGRVLKPGSTINRKSILSQWDKALHLMASIKLGYCSAAHIFRMMSAQSPKSDVYKALQGFGQLLKSSYILSYLEHPEIRRNVQKQLNRVEHGQKLSEAVFFARQGKLRVGTESDIQKAMLCKTLLKNAIIIWNYLFLSDYCCQLDDSQRQEVINSISNGSVIAWAHVNMHGVYDFDRLPSKSFKSTITQMRALKVA
ncbi:transposase, TnpA family [Spongiibacter sp. IMCC21906]|uniref:Tn3 family transposase n=1 Tax=Spongiibacter sp. IMCC21906 TaxID=1620392 RepID=UPI00062DD6DB|nr:Tn3 family transposase [Spongiibacter sp. IMCC21906]AKH69693.1 transposase, TnpA family [Spongiibacter sp. IMCC21906]